jgi:hypothetical protein
VTVAFPPLDGAFQQLVLLVMLHFLADFVLQSDRMAQQKCPGCSGTVSWPWWLTAHSACHGLAVMLVTGSAVLGLAETASHALIDTLKCRGRLSFTADQLLHLGCKVLWLAW